MYTFGERELESDIYISEFKNSKYHGQSTFTYADGSKYVGEFKNGQMHGQGTWNHLDGTKYVGELKDGKPWKVTEFDKDGNVTAVYSDGKRQKPTGTTP